MKKVPAFTLIEVTVTMLLSAVCVTICYTAFGLVEQYHATFRAKQDAVNTIGLTDHLLKKDFRAATAIYALDSGLVLTTDSVAITYLFKSDCIIRDQQKLRIDTFRVNTSGLQLSYEGNAVESGSRVDACTINLQRNGRSAPFYYYKLYSSADLFN